MTHKELVKRFNHLGNVYPSCSEHWNSIIWMILSEVERRTYNKYIPLFAKKLLAKWNIYKPVRIFQIKEKFGQLRIYDIPDDLYVYGLYMSIHTCEFCGTTNKVGQTSNGWIYTECESCHVKLHSNLKFKLL